jgi:regulator of CtrA degradation
MHIIAWLLTQKAVEAGELTPSQARAPQRRLGDAAESDPDLMTRLPPAALHLVQASRDLFARVQRLDQGGDSGGPQASPARTLMNRLESSF